MAIALGSNLGDRRAHLRFAASRLTALLQAPRHSAILETEPVDVETSQPPYLNAVIVGETALPPRELLDRLLAIEQAAGRERRAPRAPRTLDLDLILYDGVRVEEAGLVVPHPRFRARRFVLAPLAELAPDWHDPVTGKTVGQLLAALR